MNPPPSDTTDGEATADGSPTATLSIATDHDTAFFWEAAADGRLVAQRCLACQRLWHPPGPACPHCRHLEWTIDELPHDGTLFSVAKIHQPGSPIQGTHYLVALVELADPRRPGESVRYACNLRGGDLGDATIGDPVALRFEALAGGGLLPQFALVRS